MRPIKFRAWDTWINNWVEPEHLWIHANGYNGARSGFNQEYRDSLILEQFTGLLDKNGKEIYEGDIVKGEKGGLWPVVWKDDIDTDRYFTLACGFYFEFSDNYGENADPIKLEVIGNIHENPELMASSR